MDAIEVRSAGVFDGHHAIGGTVSGPDQLIELQLRGTVVMVLRVLDEHDHEKGQEGHADGGQQLHHAESQ